ncbi:hypothetical protein IVB38_01710 [Bradyrhizobium sp. 38]|nr:hypothetical protein [Bradyrhizobium sp. 38]MCK1781459.1 hypothetical protein [Bradyrhizobium sp. 132]
MTTVRDGRLTSIREYIDTQAACGRLRRSRAERTSKPSRRTSSMVHFRMLAKSTSANSAETNAPCPLGHDGSVQWFGR